jgi:DNA primase
MSETAQKVLRERYKKLYVCFDNDAPGIRDAESFSSLTGFQNVVLPLFEGGKDISDFYKLKGREEFIRTIKPLFDI